MFFAQLVAFLVTHHHHHAAEVIGLSNKAFSHWYAWAQAHGFVFQQ